MLASGVSMQRSSGGHCRIVRASFASRVSPLDTLGTFDGFQINVKFTRSC